MAKRRIACVGMGQRFESFYMPALVEEFADTWEMVGLCDNNEGRLRLRAGWMRQRGIEVRTYLDTEFDRMIAETQPDVVLVTSKDIGHKLRLRRICQVEQQAQS